MIVLQYGFSILIMILMFIKRKYELLQSNPAKLSFLLVSGFDS